MYEYKPIGTCSKKINVDIDENNIITHCEIVGGCAGNTLALSKIVIGMNAYNVIEMFKGLPCGSRKTSCPDQLANAIRDCIELRDLED